MSAAAWAIRSPVLVDPVKNTPSTSLCSTTAAPTSPKPWTTFSTPGGSPASLTISASRLQLIGAYSDGFHTTVFPAAMMWARAIEAMSVGKLYGVITPTTPSGRWVSTIRLLLVCS